MDESRVHAVADSQTDPVNGHASPQASLREAAGRLAEVREYAGYLIDAKLDSFKATGRNLLLYAVAGAIGAAIGLTIVVVAVILLMLGAAGGLGAACGGHVWIGDLIVGGAILILVGGSLAVAITVLPSLMRKRLVSKYEQRQRKQRGEFGHDVSQRAHAAHDHIGH